MRYDRGRGSSTATYVVATFFAGALPLTFNGQRSRALLGIGNARTRRLPGGATVAASVRDHRAGWGDSRRARGQASRGGQILDDGRDGSADVRECGRLVRS